jgi:hypothetical protein
MNRITKACQTISSAFETSNKAALDVIFERIHNAAQSGAYYIRLTPGDFLYRDDVKAYMQAKGFQYSESQHGLTTELLWSHPTDTNELK